MSKQQRHERRKTERARRGRALSRHPTSHMRHGAAALAAAAAIAAGTQAYAAPVRFENPPGPGHFDWAAGLVLLDLTLEAGLQGGGEAPSSLMHMPSANGYVAGRGPGPAEIRADGAYRVLAPFSVGELIPDGGSWNVYGFSAYEPYAAGLLPEGQPTYLGARFDLGAGTQYGWVGVVMTNLGGELPANIELDAFAWGYETEAGVPIPAGAPEPGSLALLAFGAAALAARRPRRRVS